MGKNNQKNKFASKKKFKTKAENEKSKKRKVEKEERIVIDLDSEIFFPNTSYDASELTVIELEGIKQGRWLSATVCIL